MNEVLSAGNLFISTITGLLAGAYLALFHPTNPITGLQRQAALQIWYFASLGSILYVGRIAFAYAAEQSDVGRIAGGWILWLLFSGALGIGAYLTGVVRRRRIERYDVT